MPEGGALAATVPDRRADRRHFRRADRPHLRDALRRLHGGLAGPGRNAAYVARAMLAVSIALYLAAWLQLESPLSAATTVLIVINPTLGAIVSKSVWRFAGTVLGAIVGVAAMAAFGQAPWLFFALMSLWVGLCCSLASVMRYFRSYGAVLSGYTLVIVAGPAYADPENIFLSAMSRLSVVVLGITVASLVFLLTTRRPRGPAVFARLAGMVTVAARLVGDAARVPARPEAERAARQASRLALLAAAAAVDEAIEFLPTDDPGIGRAVLALRLATARLLGTLSGLGLLERVTARVGAFDRLAAEGDAGDAALHFPVTAAASRALAILRETLGAVERTFAAADPSAIAANVAAPIERLRHARAALGALEAEAAVPPGPGAPAPQDADGRILDTPAPSSLASFPSAQDHPWELRQRSALRTLAFIDHAALFLDRFEDLLRAIQRLDDRGAGAAAPKQALPRLRYFHDWPTALRNGVRGALATGLCCLFWYATQWTAGAFMLAFVAPAASLLATAPSAARASVLFAGGTALAGLVAVPEVFFLLPRTDGFPMLIGALALALVPGLWLQWHPRWGLVATGYIVFLMALLGIQNPIVFDDIATLNNVVAFFLGSATLILVFRVLLPANDLREVRRLSARLVANVEALARGAPGDTSSGAGSDARRGAGRDARSWLRRRAARRRHGFAEGAIWEHLHMQVVTRLLQRAQVLPPAAREEVTDAAMTTVLLGRAILRLHDAAAPSTVLPAPMIEEIDAVMARLARLSRAPEEAARAALAAAWRLPRDAAATTRDDALDDNRPRTPDVPPEPAPGQGQGQAPGQGRHRLAATLQQIGEVLLSYPRFYDRNGPLQRLFATPGTLHLGVTLPPLPAAP